MRHAATRPRDHTPTACTEARQCRKALCGAVWRRVLLLRAYCTVLNVLNVPNVLNVLSCPVLSGPVLCLVALRAWFPVPVSQSRAVEAWPPGWSCGATRLATID